MGSVFQNKKTKLWSIRYDLPGSTREDRKQKQVTGFNSKPEAASILKLLEAQIIKGEYDLVSKSFTVKELADIWSENHFESLKPKTKEYYKGMLDRYILPKFGSARANSLKKDNVESYYRQLIKDGKSIDLVAKIHTLMRALFYYSYEHDRIPSKIMDKVKRPTLVRAEREFWSVEDRAKAIKYFKDTPVAFHVELVLLLGLRQGEVAGLRIDDIDFKDKTLKVRREAQMLRNVGIHIDKPKTESSLRTLPLTPDAIKLIKARVTWIKENKLFYGPKYNYEWDGYLSVDEIGNLIYDQRISGYYRRHMNKENCPVKKITFHDIRHTFSVSLLEKDVNLKTIQELLGHSNFSTTADIYSHVDLDKKREALNRLNG